MDTSDFTQFSDTAVSSASGYISALRPSSSRPPLLGSSRLPPGPSLGYASLLRPVAPSVTVEDVSLTGAPLAGPSVTVDHGRRPSRSSSLNHHQLAAIAENAELQDLGEQGTPDAERRIEVSMDARRKRGLRVISKAQKVSLCFVVDTTFSMDDHIKGVQDQIRHIVASLPSSGCGISGLAFVGYKDWDRVPSEHFQILPFGGNEVKFMSFLDRIEAIGGRDPPEDVLGGLAHAVSLAWPEDGSSRILFHIGDAPPHGTRFHKLEDDDYPNGHKHDPPLPALFAALTSKEIDYYFGSINSSTNQMVKVFESHYGRAIKTFDVKDPRSIFSAVSASIMDSVSVRSSVASLEKAPLRLPPMDKSVPRWALLPVNTATVMTMELPHSVEDITSMRELKPDIKKCSIQVAEHPFDHGQVRLVSHGRRLFEAGDGGPVRDVPRGAGPFYSLEEVVLKEFIKPPTRPELDKARYLVDLETQTVAAKLALDFNDRLKRTRGASHIQLKYLMAKLIKLPTAGGGERYMALENKFRGDAAMVKYTNNYHFVRHSEDPEFRERSELAVAFSHFTYEHTRGYLMVTDIQGINSRDKRGRDVMLLTDPAIHCTGPHRFGSTNFKFEGIKGFFKTHKCNRYCEALGLRAPKFE